MEIQEFREEIENNDILIPSINKGLQVEGKVIKNTESGVLVSCANGSFVGLILPKEVKNLERNDVELSNGSKVKAEVMDMFMKTKEGYYVISISKLLQNDVWEEILEKQEKDEVLTVTPTEANLGGLLVDMHGIKGFIPLSQLSPINYPRVEDGDQEKIFDKLLNLIGQDFDVRIINIDEEGKRVILSEKEALKEEKEKIMNELEVGKIYEGTISGVSSYGLFVTIGGGIEGLVHVSEITYGHVRSIEDYGQVGDDVKVKVIGHDEGKISLSMKRLKPDPWSVIPKKYSVGDVVEGEVVRFVPYGAFIRLYDDVNALVHLSELSTESVSNPAEVVKLGQKVKAKIILLNPKQRKAGLSIKALKEDSSGSNRSNGSSRSKRKKKKISVKVKPKKKAKKSKPKKETKKSTTKKKKTDKKKETKKKTTKKKKTDKKKETKKKTTKTKSTKKKTTKKKKKSKSKSDKKDNTKKPF